MDRHTSPIEGHSGRPNEVAMLGERDVPRMGQFIRMIGKRKRETRPNLT